MGILDKIKGFLPKRKEPELKNNVPKEKENIRKTFGVYCHNNHNNLVNLAFDAVQWTWKIFFLILYHVTSGYFQRRFRFDFLCWF